MSDKLGSFLENKVDNKNLNEDIITATLLSGTVAIIVNLTLTLISAQAMIKGTITDTKLTKEINKILGSTKWKVKCVDAREPNAYVIGPRVIFVTEGLKKLLTKRELIAVMIHEAYHVRNLHVYKTMLANYPFVYYTMFIILTMGSSIFILNLFAFILLIKIFKIPFDITVGRRYESDADIYTIEFGYEKEMISALKKLETYIQKSNNKSECGVICKAQRKISEIIDEHPSIKRRIAHILKQKELWDKVKTGKFSLIKNYLLKQFSISPKEASTIEKGI